MTFWLSGFTSTPAYGGKIYRKKMTYFIALYACNMQIQVKSIGKPALSEHKLQTCPLTYKHIYYLAIQLKSTGYYI